MYKGDVASRFRVMSGLARRDLETATPQRSSVFWMINQTGGAGRETQKGTSWEVNAGTAQADPPTLAGGSGLDVTFCPS